MLFKYRMCSSVVQVYLFELINWKTFIPINPIIRIPIITLCHITYRRILVPAYVEQTTSSYPGLDTIPPWTEVTLSLHTCNETFATV